MIVQSPITYESPMALAQQIAQLLDSDPIAARQVREHLSDERIYELLELPPAPTSTLDEALDNCTVEDIEAEVRERFPLNLKADVNDETLVAEILRRWPTRASRIKEFCSWESPTMTNAGRR